MKPRSTSGAGARFSGPQEVMETLDRLEDRLDGITDRLNALWDRVVQAEAPGVRETEAAPPEP